MHRGKKVIIQDDPSLTKFDNFDENLGKRRSGVLSGMQSLGKERII